MYGGLFGDLPSTKNDSKKAKKEDELFGNLPKTKEERAISDGRSNQLSQSMMVSRPETPSEGSTKEGQASDPKQSNSLGFKPTALFQPKRKRKQSSSSTKPKPTPPAFTTTAKVVQELAATTPAAAVVLTKEAGKGDTQKEETHSVSLTQEPEQDPPELQKLHSEVTDPYDPLVPNDLLAYWEHQKAEEHRVQLEEEARRTLKNQQRLREELEAEKERLVRQNDLEGLQQRMGGMGRGRGVNQLPAWLVAKQKAKGGGSRN